MSLIENTILAKQRLCRRSFLRSAALAVNLGASSRAAPQPVNLLLLTNDEGEAIRKRLTSSERILAYAAAAKKAGPWSVAAHRPQYLDITPHEYFSEGPYWWPDGKDPKAPYIRRDGLRNPDRFTNNREDLGKMCTATLALGMAGYFLDDRTAIAPADRILRAWFLDSGTRMDPNLEHGQAIRNRNEGRGTGIVDTVSLIHCVQGIALLAAAGLPVATVNSLREWFANYLAWMTDSKKGQDEMRSGNNHMTWWHAQAAAYAGFTGNRQRQTKIWEAFRTTLVAEIRPGGSCPKEEVRTTSLSYSTFNADAFCILARLAQIDGVDLWGYLEKMISYLMPFVEKPDTWKHRQIAPFTPDSIVFPALAAHGLRSDPLLRAYKQLPRSRSPWIDFVDLLA